MDEDNVPYRNFRVAEPEYDCKHAVLYAYTFHFVGAIISR